MQLRSDLANSRKPNFRKYLRFPPSYVATQYERRPSPPRRNLQHQRLGARIRRHAARHPLLRGPGTARAAALGQPAHLRQARLRAPEADPAGQAPGPFPVRGRRDVRSVRFGPGREAAAREIPRLAAPSGASNSSASAPTWTKCSAKSRYSKRNAARSSPAAAKRAARRASRRARAESDRLAARVKLTFDVNVK